MIAACLALLQCGWQDGSLINGLLDIVDSTCYDPNDEITNAAIRLLVALHHMLIQHDRTRLGILSDNLILGELARRPESSRTFGECFVFLLNREGEPYPANVYNIAIKFMCVELLWSILQSPPLSNYFYDNDRNVLVDILLQNIADLADDTDQVRALCLNTLGALICYTEYRQRPHKLSQVRRLLRELLNTGRLLGYLSDRDEQ
ncbi:hypothetical protein SYNPS1DRAFT_31878 [Syncephalis pseudoplumigaleata]|uniref:SPIN90/Ldb17 leucine-rich domain-containing protein n=1 Tax=Syncephalis pseudoplumigaleata TaxID=1712513 RepID=A0A4P9YUH4_9FUNG|nr:hypothetical protein SYNPS1DRAFT_31878 [Syncephalis pseudoplumigaleata]|eukprot:RKP22520.1 hypothetical protein SYNPS1DRAFT_31878 [Syncephalis pseudoplumigaleata]